MSTEILVKNIFHQLNYQCVVKQQYGMLNTYFHSSQPHFHFPVKN